MNRHIWNKWFYENSIPAWGCPSCFAGVLVAKNETFSKMETSASRCVRLREARNPEGIEYVFSCVRVCENIYCNEVVVISGRGSVDNDFNPETNKMEFLDVFEAKYVYPSPHIIHLPKSSSKELKDEFISAFTLYWSDIRACANRIRSCVELILTEYHIKRFEIKKGKRKRLSLHERIELFSYKNATLGDALMAIKWIGNEGSHIGKLTKDDLLDAFEMLEHVLDELFEKRKEKIGKLVKAINKKKGPISK